MDKYSWYALRVRGGKENKTKEAISATATEKGLQSYIKRIHVPAQRVYTLRKGKREVRKNYFSYLIVEANLAQVGVKEALMDTENVRGFVSLTGWGRNHVPVPLREEEVQQLLGREQKAEKIQNNVDPDLKKGDQVEIIDGIFQGNMATVQDIDPHRKKISVSIQIFKKSTNVELTYTQIKRK